MLAGDVHAHKIAGFGIETVCAGPSTAARANLSAILQIAVFDELKNNFGCRWDADIQFFTEIGNAASTLSDTQSDDSSLFFGHD